MRWKYFRITHSSSQKSMAIWDSVAESQKKKRGGERMNSFTKIWRFLNFKYFKFRSLSLSLSQKIWKFWTSLRNHQWHVVSPKSWVEEVQDPMDEVRAIQCTNLDIKDEFEEVEVSDRNVIFVFKISHSHLFNKISKFSIIHIYAYIIPPSLVSDLHYFIF